MKKWNFECYGDWEYFFLIPTVVVNRNMRWRTDEPTGID